MHLYLKPFNEDSFTRKSVFTVTYIMAHVEVEEIKEKKEAKIIQVKQMRSAAEAMEGNFKKNEQSSEESLGNKIPNPPKL